MHPLITLFGAELSAYALFGGLAAAAAFLLALPFLRRMGLSRWQAAVLPILMAVGFLIGARLWNVAVNPTVYPQVQTWYALRFAGLSLYGGLLGAGLVLAVVPKLWKQSVWRAFDAMVVPGGAALCIARVGCFLAGCCGGRKTDSIFGLVFPSKEAARQTLQAILPFFPESYAVHPTQLYELAGAALGLVLLPLLLRAAFRKRRPADGTFFLLFAAWFSAVRLAVLPLRALTYADVIKTVIYPLIYLAAILLGILLALWRNKD